MLVKFLKNLPTLSSPEYQSLMAGRNPDSQDGVVDVVVYWILKQASHVVPAGLFGHELDLLIERSGLSSRVVAKSVASLVLREFIEVVDCLAGVQDAATGPNPEDVFNAWNHRVRDNNRRPGTIKLLKAVALTDGRRKKIVRRLLEQDWWPAYQKALQLVPVGNRAGFNWQPTLDWLIKNETNALRIAEGQYQTR